MKHRSAIFALSLLLLAACLILASCGVSSNCNGLTFGGGGGSGSGGTFNTGGSVCGPGTGHGGGSVADIVYYLGNGPLIDAAGVNGSTFANITGYTPVGFPNSTGFGENFWIVNKKFLYIPVTPPATPAAGAVWAYTITRSSGALSVIGSSPFPTSQRNADIAVSDPQGRFLFVSDKGDGTIAVFTIDQNTGALTLSGSPLPTGSSPTNMTVDGTGSYLYFPYGGAIYGFTIDQNTGALTPMFPGQFGIPMKQLQADPSGAYLLGVTGNGFSSDNNVYVIPIAPGTGSLGVPTAFATTAGPEFLALSPNGKYLFTFAEDNTLQPLPLEGFTFDATTGTLTAMTNSPFASLPKVVTATFDQAGTTMIGLTGSSFTVYAVDANTGAPSSTLPSLSVLHDERYAVTN
ncbi:MAG TPA: beta-propeller fold lactonase family protein [Terriglobales bacterium]|nr:beta-propeller fold lactonase family protein [Terriglobales bacterium]